MRMQDGFVFARQADMKNLGLRMIDPNDRMEVAGHVGVLVSNQSSG